ncbi:RadC family protein [Aquimarina agarivorans]|uniref:RadC family protein n=1 Tax=Aquimarina agarivorans TaxID=980584 RepID=UPI000248EB9C|nr:DNA repair protein RadC [Aquimarina agarivorans]
MSDFNFPITQWSEADKPREKLAERGKKALTDAELLGILIGSGSRNESAVNLCKRILASVDNNLNELSRLSVAQLTKFKGIGQAKAITIVAGLEIGRRQQLQDVPLQPVITCSNDVFVFMQPLIGDLHHEEFWVLFLNNANKVIHRKMLSSGGQTGTLIDVRMVYKLALEVSAVALILTHNHPSGKLTPSQADLKLTDQIKNAGVTLNIKVLDHLIVTEKAYYSFADEGSL